MTPIETPENLLGSRIRAERERRSLSLDQLATRVGLSNRSQLSRIETGERGVSSVLLRRIALELGVPMDAFFDEERAEVLALARTGNASDVAIQRMVDEALELLADMEFAERMTRDHG
jgi:transcriptional regulator with XRE-family HTH domain